MTQMKHPRARFLIGASVLALTTGGLAAPGFAQTAAPAATTPATTTVGEVVVTARRKALQTATERKKNSDTIIDSIVADEAGKLPDTSITEVLQRVAGVTITRFASLSSPDQFSFEGTGIQVRGLSGVTSLLNGQEVDSANGGGGLSWGDVTPELMSAVDVYKQSTADLIEGGLGGAIDLRTRMPFDYKKPEVDLNASAAYSDFAKGTAPQVSLMATDRWDTPIGQFGALVDLAYARYFYADSFARTEPYYQEANSSGSPIYVPGGFDYGNDEFDRTRRGLYAAFQWRPNSDLTIYQTDFVSNYHQTNGGGGVFVAQDCCATPGSNDIFDSKGVFQGGTISYGTASNPGASPGNSNNYNPSDNTEADFNQGFVWTPTQKLRIQGAAEIVESGAYAGDFGLGVASNNVYEEGINGLHGNLPSFTLPGLTPGTTGPDTAIATNTGAISDIIWNTQKNKAQQIALNLDVDYDLGDGFFKSVKAGVRYQTRDEKDDFTGTWWSATDRGWNGYDSATGQNAPQQTVAMNPKDTSLYTFPNFFKGKVTVPTPYYFFTQTSPQEFMHDVDLYTANLGSAPTNCGPQTFPAVPANSPDTVNFGNCPNDVHTNSQTFDAYVLTKFGHDQIGWLPAFSGNIGVRLVHDYVESIGAYTVNGGTTSTPFYVSTAAADAAYQAAGGAAAIFASYQKGAPANSSLLNYEAQYLTGSSEIRKETKHYTLALPDVNVAFKPSSQWVVRFALDQTVSPPGFNDIRSSGSTSVGQTLKNPNQAAFLAYQESQGVSSANAQNLPGVLENLSYNSGNTGLNPAVSTNEDISVEWYPSSSTTAHVDVFNKSIKNEIIYNSNTYFEDVPSSAGNLSQPVSGTSDYNAQKTATLTGAEFGARTYFDKLPGAFKGIGIEANYTIINSHSPGDLATDMTGNQITGLPIVGLSKTSYNINLLYDLGPWDARLAYNWRSKYLATTTGNGTTGSYTPPSPQAGDVLTGGEIAYGLPVYAAAAAYLDAHLSYKVNDRMSIAFDGSNLLNTVSKTLEEILPGDFQVRSWFMNDVRYSFSVSAKF